MNIQTVTNVSDCVPLYLPHSLYLKPLAKFNISVSLPSTNKMGKSISNYDIMDKLTNAIKPDKCLVVKVSKSTLEFIRFEAELEDRSKLRQVLARLDGLKLKVSGFNEPFKVRASEAKDDFPTRHDWDSFFRDARNMDEMKPGERPDTIHISNLPIRWFCPRHMENDDNVKPSENIFKRIFEKFGSVRCVDIPICDAYRSQMKTEITGMKTFNFDQEVMFEGYVQFSEYVGFVKAMDEFRGMKLVRKCGDKNQAINIYVNFDKTKHLSDASIKRRHIVRERLIAKERAKEEEEAKAKKEEQERLERERKKQDELKQKELERQREREEKRKEKHLKKLREKGQLDITQKIRQEEKKLMIAQRKLESIRILEALFERIKLKESQLVKVKEEDGETSSRKKKIDNDGTGSNKKVKTLEKNDLRNKLVHKYKSAHEELIKKQKTKLEQVKGKTGLLALLDGDKHFQRSPSINTISSDDSVLSDSHQIILKKKRKKKKKASSDSSSSSSSSSENDEKEDNSKKKNKPVNNNPFNSMYNPEMAADWLQMGFYPYAAPVFPGLAPLRPPLFPNPALFRGNFNPYRGRGRGRGRGGRGGQLNPAGIYPYDSEQYYKYYKRISGTANDYEPYKDEHDRRRSRSYSRSRSKSHYKSRSRRSRSRRSRSRSSTRSRGRDKNRSRSSSRSRSRSRTRNRSRSRRRTTTKSRSRSKQKLASTRRSRSPQSSSSWSRSKSRSRSRSWSRNAPSPSSSQKQDKIAIHPQKLVKSAKEIQRSVQQKLHDRLREEEENKRNRSNLMTRDEAEAAASSRKRSASIDSSKFVSPKRREKSETPERDWERESRKSKEK